MKMPILKPIPIQTKGLPCFKSLWVWLVSVREWEVVEDWEYDLNGTTIIIPKNFVFDGASIPKIFRGFLSPVGILLIPGLLHDYAYKYDYLDTVVGKDDEYAHYHSGQRYWDRMFRDIAIEVNGFKTINYIAWIALYCFGFMAWNKHRKAENAYKHY